MSRRDARRRAVEILYAADLRSQTGVEVLDAENDVDAYTRHLVAQVDRRRAEIDDLLARVAVAWPLERMSAVDRNVLRVGVAELLEADAPAPVVIDEAIEIAKHFSGDDAGRFVNGVLASLHRRLRHEDSPSGS